MTEDGDIPEGDDLLAAEYALGLLSEEENARVEARLDADAGFRARVVFWHEHFAAIAGALPEVTPPAEVWRRLEASLPREAPAVRPVPQPRAVPSADTSRRVRPQRPPRVGVWRGVAGLATAAALALAALLFVDREAPDAPEGPLFAGEVRAEDASQRFVVAYDPDTATLRLARAAGGAAPDRSLQLWAIQEGQDPVPLAVLPEDERFEVVVPEPLRPRFDAATLAISDEPSGGSPTGQPTGPVVAVGRITRL